MYQMILSLRAALAFTARANSYAQNFVAFLKEDLRRWAKVAKESVARAD